MKRTTSLKFPFRKDIITSGLERNDTVEATLNSAIKSFLMTKKNSRMGNPIGSSLTDMIQNTYTNEKLSIKEEDILTELGNQFPEVKFIKFDLMQNFVDLFVRIKYFTAITNIQEFEFKI